MDITTEDFDWSLPTNLYALFWITRAAIPRLTPGAAIIDTTAVTAFDPPTQLLDYAMTKAAILNFTRGLAR
jgi:NAD(P)-dependent dehydrogenase (short-subunit alcohol dehydrogenase family)